MKKKKSLNGRSRCPWLNQIGHIEWPCVVKLAILIWLVSLLVMPTWLPTYLSNIYLFMSYLPIYLNMS